MFEAAWNGFLLLMTGEALLFIIIGVSYGLFIGFLPGLGGIVAMALLLPFVGGMNPAVALGLLLSAHVATLFGSTITSVLFGVPGASKTVAMCFDGYPMTLNGEAPRALGAAAFSSLIGGIIGAFVLIVSLPFMRSIMLAVGPPEYFMMALWGLSIIAIFSEGSIFKGMAAACFGLLLAFVGMDPVSGTPRYTFGSIHFFDGLDFAVCVIGFFAVSQMIELYIKGGSISRTDDVLESKSTVWQGMKDCWTHRWLIVRSAILGVYIGALPGVGATTGGIAAYGLAAQTSKNPESFGKGNVAGVIAPECTNAANEGGGLIPTLGFGVPGGESMAILLSAFMAMGIAPGREMIESNLDLVFSMVWIIVIANIFTTSIGLAMTKRLAKMASIDVKILFPLVLAICLSGAYAVRGELFDVLLAVAFGYIGYFMKKFQYSRGDMVIGMVLGLMFERYLHISVKLYGGTFFLTRPVALALLLLIVFTCVYPFWKARKREKQSRSAT